MEDKGLAQEGTKQPVTDYKEKYDLSNDQLTSMKNKFQKGKDFVNPTTDCEKEYALDMIIE